MQEQTDLSEDPHAHEYRNKGVMSERSASPSPSSVSLRTDWSMDPPTNFKDFPLNTRVNSERAASPVPSYMSLKTDWSMDPPANFKDFSSDTRFEEDKETAASINSHQMDNTFMLKLLTEHHLKCPVCKSLLKDPVSMSCGHNCCRDCINAFWDNCSAVYVCPQCGEVSETRPVLNTNTALAEVVKNLQQAGFSPALPAQAYAGPQDVACDFCTDTEQRLKAVKACSTCDIFLCETHIRQHYTIPALQKHTLSDVTGDMKTRPSQHIQSSENSYSVQTDTTQDIRKDVKSIPEPVLNTSTMVPEEAAKTGMPETRVNKEDTDIINATKLKQEMSGLQISSSKKQNQYYEDDDYYREEDDYYEEREADVDDDVYYGEEDFGADNNEEEAADGQWDDEVHINDWDVKGDIYDVDNYTHDYDNHYDDFTDSYDCNNCDDDY